MGGLNRKAVAPLDKFNLINLKCSPQSQQFKLTAGRQVGCRGAEKQVNKAKIYKAHPPFRPWVIRQIVDTKTLAHTLARPQQVVQR